MKLLKWIGDGSSVIPGFPPRDLTQDDLEKGVRRVGSAKTVDELKKQLIDTGLYEAVKQSKKQVNDGNN